MLRRWIPLGLVLLAAMSGPAQSQSLLVADSLLRIGAIDRAEAAYYAASRANPRDPEARFALGKFLVSRGAFRIGATLINEALQFGYSRTLGNTALAAVYARTGDYTALEKLSPSPLSKGERAQVRWMADHPTKTMSADSTVLVAFARTNAAGFIGTTRIRVNGRSIVASVAPRSGCGIRIADTATFAQTLHRFPGESGAGRPLYATADSVALGRVSIDNVPVTIEQLSDGGSAIVCFDLLGRFAPTFDAKAGLMTLHLAGIAPRASATATVYPLLELNGPWGIPQAGGWVPLVLPRATDLLRGHRWTFDPRRGQIEVEP